MAASNGNTEQLWLNRHITNFQLRLGNLKALAHVTPDGSSTQRDVAKDLWEMLGRTVNPGTKPKFLNLEDYIVAKESLGSERIERSSLELQDVYLSDVRLPSNLGAVPRKAVHVLVDWGAWIGLLSDTFGATPYTQILTILAAPDGKSFETYVSGGNPYMLSANQKLFFLHQWLSYDGGLIRRLLPKLVSLKSFDRAQTVGPFREALEELLVELEKTDITGQDAGESGALAKLVEVLGEEAAREKAEPQYRALTGIQRLSTRLEVLVDLGFLLNTSDEGNGLKLAFKYKGTDATSKLSRALEKLGDRGRTESDRFEWFLSEAFFRDVSSLTNSIGKRISDHETLFAHFCRAYSEFAGEVGPRLIKPISLLAAVRAATSGAGYFELSDLKPALVEFRDSLPEQVSLSGGHERGVAEFVQISPGLVEKYAKRRR
jgi:hypothetical protein